VTPDKATAQEDVAFLKSILSPDPTGAWQRTFGKVYALWGGGFAIPLLFECARAVGFITLPSLFWPFAALVVTLILLPLTYFWTKGTGPAVGSAAKSANAIFGGVGWANLAVLIGLIFASKLFEDNRIMMIHAAVVFAFQGAAWYAVWALRRVGWIGLVSAGWYIAAIASAATMNQISVFIPVVTAAMLLLMVAPGLYMIRKAR